MARSRSRAPPGPPCQGGGSQARGSLCAGFVAATGLLTRLGIGGGRREGLCPGHRWQLGGLVPPTLGPPRLGCVWTELRFVVIPRARREVKCHSVPSDEELDPWAQLLGGGALLDAMPTVLSFLLVLGRLLDASAGAQKRVGVGSQALGEGQGRRTPFWLTFELTGPTERAPPSHHPAGSAWLSRRGRKENPPLGVAGVGPRVGRSVKTENITLSKASAAVAGATVRR